MTVILFLVRNTCIDKLELAQCFVMVEWMLSWIPLCRVFSPHIFPQMPWEVNVVMLVCSMSMWKKSLMHSCECQKKTMSMLFTYEWTCDTFLGIEVMGSFTSMNVVLYLYRYILSPVFERNSGYLSDYSWRAGCVVTWSLCCPSSGQGPRFVSSLTHVQVVFQNALNWYMKLPAWLQRHR